MKILLPILLLFSINSHANAGLLPCKDLAAFCEDVGFSEADIKDTFEAGFCTGFIDGMTYGDANRSMALPKDGTILQLLNVVMKWIRENPEQWHRSAGHCVWSALEEAGWMK